MSFWRKNERRHAQHPRLELEPAFLFRVPPRLAWPLVLFLLGVVGLAETFFPQVWFGPVYLAVFCLVAWSIGARVALGLGLVLITSKVLLGLPGAETLAVGEAALRVVCVGIVTGFIALARKSCTREWWLARTDLLTGAINRQAFFELIRSGRCSRGGVVLIYADLDGLKKLNDEAGHAAGDRSLKAFSDTVRRTMRAGGAFARMGGDEFVIVALVREEAAGHAIAARLDAALNGDAWTGGPHLRSSLGVLVLPRGSQSIDDELRAADALMYKAKHAGTGVAVATMGDRGIRMLEGGLPAASTHVHGDRRVASRLAA